MAGISIDSFKEYRYPLHLRTNDKDAAAFILKQVNMDENRYDTDVWILGEDGPVRLTNSGNVKGFWWKGDDIIFSALREKKDKEQAEKGLPITVLYRISTRAPGEAEEWLRLEHPVGEIAFLEDGRMLFTAGYEPLVDRLLRECEDHAEAAEKLKEERDYEVFTEIPFWSNGGGFIRGARVRLYLYDRGGITALTDEKTNVEHLRVSPDGTTAYYLAERFETKMPLYNRLMQLNLSSLVATDITFAPELSHSGFAVMEDGRLFVAAHDAKAYGINQNPVFYFYSPDSKALRTVDDSGRYSCWDSVGSDLKQSAGTRMFALDGAAYFVATVGHSSYVMRADEASVAPLAETEGAVSEIAPANGAIVAVAMRGVDGQELYSVGLDGSEQPLTSFNESLSVDLGLFRPEPLSFTNSEGTLIQGWVLPPAGVADGKSYPTILDIHGGPKTVYGTVAFHEMQYWAALGYGVLFCNPTGGDGGGDEFADIRGRYGLIDYADLMQFVDEAISRYDWIDTARLGVTGGSYGGYMTNWIIGHTNRFKAAASQRSISNWVSMATISDIGFYFVPDQASAEIWSDIKDLWEQSPLAYADKVTTPTLFIHSDEDYRCPEAEGMQMYTALQMQGVETRMCLFHGENHELSRGGKPKHRVRRLQEITEWFDRHLKETGAQ